MAKAERIYLNVISDISAVGYIRPRVISWEDGRVFRIDEVRDRKPASFYIHGVQGDCYTVVIRGETRRIFLERTHRGGSRLCRWFIEKTK